MIMGFFITVSLGKYLIKAFSIKKVRLISSTTACALACLRIEGLIKSVTRCLSIVILHILQLIVVVVNKSDEIVLLVLGSISSKHHWPLSNVLIYILHCFVRCFCKIY